MKIYSITYTSYDGLDNYLHSESKTTINEDDAKKIYEKWKDNALENGECDGDYEDVYSEEIELDENTSQYLVQRNVGLEDEYQAMIVLNFTNIEE